ncbi:MAG TPA: PH domain-containing protein [Streptosporangiaceae bacterium]
MSGQSSAVRNRGLPAAGPEVFRLTTPVALWWIWIAFAAANAIDLAVQGSSAHSGLVIGAILLVITGFAYTLALRPRVVADQSGITVVNPFRDHHVPWAVIQGVDTGDWVRVHHTKDGSAVTAVDVPGQAVECWALYVSARTKRRAAVGTPAPRRSRGFGGLAGFAGFGEPPDEHARMPAEAKYLASLPPVKAIASLLDTRAEKERARLRQASPDPAGAESARPSPVTARWAWFPFAAIAVPALLIIALLA